MTMEKKELIVIISKVKYTVPGTLGIRMEIKRAWAYIKRIKRNKIYLQLVDENRIFFKNSKKLIHKSNQTNSYDLFRYIGPEGNLIGDMIKHNSINIKTNTKRLSTNIFISNYSDKKSGLLYFNDNNDISKYNYLKLNLDFPFNQKKSCNNLYYEGVGEVFFNTSY